MVEETIFLYTLAITLFIMAGIQLPSESEIRLRYLVEIGASPEGEGMFTKDGRGSSIELQLAKEHLDMLESAGLISKLLDSQGERTYCLTESGGDAYKILVELSQHIYHRDCHRVQKKNNV